MNGPTYLRMVSDVADEVEALEFGDMQRVVAAALRAQAARDEAMVKAAIRERFPRAGPWLVAHPRALRLLFRLRPGLRPTLISEQGMSGFREVRWPAR
jgi:hypothetical protein